MKNTHYFIAGFLSTLIIHQGLLHLLYVSGVVPAPAWSFKSTEPFGIPSVLSLALFGGLWGIAQGWLLSLTTEDHFWLKSFFFGALMPTMIAVAVVFPLKGIEVTISRVFLGMMLNGSWGLGTSAYIFIREKYPLIRKDSLRSA